MSGYPEASLTNEYPGDGYVVVKTDDVRSVLRNGVDWTDDHGPTVRLADAVNATVSRAQT